MQNLRGGGLRVDLRPSPVAALVLAAGYSGAALGALALPLLPWSAVAAAGALLPSAWRSFGRHALRRGPKAIVRIVRTDAGEWRLLSAAGERIGECIPSSAFVHPLLCIVCFSSPRGRLRVLVPAGAVDADEARRLRIVLRRLATASTRLPVAPASRDRVG